MGQLSMTAQAMQFRKDKNDDGSENSIYLICFRTVGWKNRNADLEVAGRDHIRIRAISYEVFAEPNSEAAQLIRVAGMILPPTCGVALQARGYTWTNTGLRTFA
jgi:hypothetical protein